MNTSHVTSHDTSHVLPLFDTKLTRLQQDKTRWAREVGERTRACARIAPEYDALARVVIEATTHTTPTTVSDFAAGWAKAWAAKELFEPVQRAYQDAQYALANAKYNLRRAQIAVRHA